MDHSQKLTHGHGSHPNTHTHTQSERRKNIIKKKNEEIIALYGRKILVIYKQMRTEQRYTEHD